MPIRPAAVRKVFHSRRAIPRMSWAKHNVFNIWKRTDPGSRDSESINFKQHQDTLFQERWKSKTLTKGYHADFIASKVFQRWYLPEALPTIRTGDHTGAATSVLSKWVEGRERAGGRNRREKELASKSQDGRSPVGTMMFAEVERRIDVAIFRACFATSVWQARRFVRQRAVKVNGKIIDNANFLLSPGDIFTVKPEVITLINPKAWAAEVEDPVEADEAEAAGEEGVTSAAEETDAPAEGEAAKVEEAEKSEVKEEEAEEKKADEFSDVVAAENAPSPERHAPGKFFRLPDYAQTQIFVPAYILPSYLTCSAVYVRHPTARPGYSEIPSPYNADGQLMSLSWEWYQKVAPRMKQSRRLRLMDPQRSQDRK